MKTTTKFFLIASMILGLCPAVNAGKPVRVNDISMNAIVSGNGFGLQYNPSLGFRLGERSVVYGGPTFCAADWNSTGYQFGVKYLVVKEQETYSNHFRLGITANAMHFHDACLSAATISREVLLSHNMNNEGADFSMLKYKGWEYSAGISFSYHTSFGLFVRTEVGAGWYNSEQKGSCAPVSTYRENHGMSLRLGAGIGWSFTK